MYDNTNWLKLDTLTASVYYGYSPNQNAADTDYTWAIKKVNTSGTVQSTTWANGSASQQISSWSNRYVSFAAPTQSISITYSTYTPYAYSDIDINIKWNQIPGIDNYQISVTDQFNFFYSDGGYQIYNNNNLKPLTTVVYSSSATSSLNYVFKYAQPGITYSIMVTGINVSGSTSSTITLAL